MGRTLHFSIQNPEELTEEHKEICHDVSINVNSGPFENVWTCENFFLDPFDFDPRWENTFFTNMSRPEIWKYLDKEYEALINKGNSRLNAVKNMVERGLVVWSDSVRGSFCKVGGNEFNAWLVMCALLEISNSTPAVIELSDEGEFLYADIILKNGKAKINKKAWKRDLEYWKKEGVIDDNTRGIADKIKFVEKLLKKYPSWTGVENLCRDVEPSDFTDHPQYGVSQIMAGFNGEYYGLTKEDAEKRSYEISAHIMKMLEKAGIPKKDIKIAPNLKDL
jgi:hypothetical protein